MYDYLDQHPHVYTSPIKEPSFFSPEVADLSPQTRATFAAERTVLQSYLDGPMSERGRRGWVLEWEQYLKLFRHVRDETAVGEASVSYLGALSAPRAIHERIPHARIIVVLRDPADRLFSHYAALRSAGASNLTFPQWAVRQSAAEASPQPLSLAFRAGMYAEHLRRYLGWFPDTQIHVVLYDDYVRAPDVVLRELFAFLDVDPNVRIDQRVRRHVTAIARFPLLHRPPMRPLAGMLRVALPSAITARVVAWLTLSRGPGPTAAERAQVIELYAHEIRALEPLIGRDLSGWRDPDRLSMRR